eukprot:TRINITY_DN11873_c0_g1_i1.p1 TRINITY_DN11873_c0_g1~~TRINITY_DN11873_c0_g1_i1.p1  ORF type:complete len:170 (-),score=21.56 TRINITY_DN11873_c0_g1_i1:100-609(-)
MTDLHNGKIEVRESRNRSSQAERQPPSRPAAAKLLTGKVRRWEKKWVKLGHLQIYKWIPVDSRESMAFEKPSSQKSSSLKLPVSRTISENAPITRSITAAFNKRLSDKRKADRADDSEQYNEAGAVSPLPQDLTDPVIDGESEVGGLNRKREREEDVSVGETLSKRQKE